MSTITLPLPPTSTITPRSFAIGRALLGETADNTPAVIGIRQQHDILKQATLAELVAAKVIIQRFHSDNQYAVLLADCYLSAKTRDVVKSVAS